MTDLQLGKIEFGDRHGRSGGLDIPMPAGAAVPMDSPQNAINSLMTLLAALDKRVMALEKQAARRKRRNTGITSLDPHDLAVRQSIKDTLAKEARAIKKGRV